MKKRKGSIIFGIKNVDEMGKALERDNLGKIKGSALAVLLLEISIKHLES